MMEEIMALKKQLGDKIFDNAETAQEESEADKTEEAGSVIENPEEDTAEKATV